MPASYKAISAGAASTTTPGAVELATDTEAKALSSQTLAVTPGNLAAVFAEPPALGSTTPAAVSATVLKAGNGSAGAPSLASTNFPTTGFFFPVSGNIEFSTAGSTRMRLASDFLNINASAGLRFWSDASAFSTVLTTLLPEAANTLAQRNGTAAQTQRVYNTYTDASNGEWISVKWSANQAEMVTERLGTGVGRDLLLGTNSANQLLFRTNAITRWAINSAGLFYASTDNANDIGASGSNRPRTLYLGTNIIVGGAGVIGAASPAATAILELSSTTKGFLPPRMTTAQRDAISTPAEGLLIYNTTTGKLNFRTSSAWEAVTSV